MIKQAEITNEVKLTKADDYTPIGHVFYTDGGCRQVAGWGLHGYSYKIDGNHIKNVKNQDAPTHLGYTDKKDIVKDGAPVEKDTEALEAHVLEGKSHPRKSIPIKVDKYVDGWGTVDYEDATNNTAEIKAALEGLKIATEAKSAYTTILTDSQYVIGGATDWHRKWSKNNWRKPDGSPVQNAELWKELLEEQKKLGTVTWKWVKGHSGDLGNESSDTNATRGVNKGRRGEKYSTINWQEVGGYWNPKNPYNRFLSHPYWYFVTNLGEDKGKSKDGRHVYYTGNHGNKNELAGKAAQDHTYSVCFLKEPEEILSKIEAEQSKVSDGVYEDIIFGYLSSIFLPKVYNELTVHGCDYVVPPLPNRSDDLILWDDLSKGGVQLTQVAKPPKISQRIFDYCGLLEGILEDFIEGDETLISTDITDEFFETETKGKKEVTKLKKSVANSPSLAVVANYKTGDTVKQRSVTVSLSLDCPNKNALARLAERSPKVTLLTWRESKRGFRYAIVIESGGDIGIWCSVHSNLIVVI